MGRFPLKKKDKEYVIVKYNAVLWILSHFEDNSENLSKDWA
jgi:hypothetical protein